MNPNPLRHLQGRLPAAFGVIALLTARALALTPHEWRASQTLEVSAPGLVRVDLPPATLDGARPGLEDLRFLDAAGSEVPFLIRRPTPRPESVLRPNEFRVAIEADATKLIVKTGTTMPLAAVTLETPAVEFNKPVGVEGSHDGENWEALSTGEPIFRLAGGATKLRVALPEAPWEFLRLTIDDRRAPPVPFTGAQLHTPQSPAPVGAIPVTIKSRDETPGVTRLALDLSAANLTLASLRIETSEPLFTRRVTLAVPEITEDGIREKPLDGAVIYRVDVAGKAEARLDIPIEKQIRARELVVFVHNGDSPPLGIDGFKGERRLVQLVFFAREAGRYSLLSGNSQCAAPRYDVSALSEQLKDAAGVNLEPSALVSNPEFQPPEALAALTLSGAPIDVAEWKFRKPVTLTRSGPQQIELDLHVLAHARADQSDLRLVRDGRQIPFLLERPSITRPIKLEVAPKNDPKKPSLSRWSLQLPQAGVPLSRLVCSSTAPLFQRDLRLWEEVTDQRGDKHPRELGRTSWSRVPNQPLRDFVLPLDSPPQSDTVWVETDNGDNPPIDLVGVRGYYPLTRLVFKATSDLSKPIWLCYGKRDAAAPRYDLSLVSGELLAAERTSASLGLEENMRSRMARAGETISGWAKVIFFCALGLVVAGLLALISKLVPKPE